MAVPLRLQLRQIWPWHPPCATHIAHNDVENKFVDKFEVHMSLKSVMRHSDDLSYRKLYEESLLTKKYIDLSFCKIF
jgi:hypothetical protein